MQVRRLTEEWSLVGRSCRLGKRGCRFAVELPAGWGIHSLDVCLMNTYNVPGTVPHASETMEGKLDSLPIYWGRQALITKHTINLHKIMQL